MTDREEEKELQACSPIAVDPDSFNPDCDLPYGLETIHIYQAMNEFIDFIGFINGQLKDTSINCHLADFKRLEPLKLRCHSQENLY